MTNDAGTPFAASTRSLRRRSDSDVRVGDAERDNAVEAIGEHFAAGRLDHSELEDRIEAAWRARTRGELDALFADLPSAPTASRVGRPTPSGTHHATRRPPVALLGLLLIVALIVALPGPPFLLIPLLWIFVVTRVARGAAHQWVRSRS